MFGGSGRVRGNMSRATYSESRAARRRPLDKAEEETAERVVEFRISGLQHVSREWASGDWIIAVDNRETQEGPGRGKWRNKLIVQPELF